MRLYEHYRARLWMVAAVVVLAIVLAFTVGVFGF